MRKYQLSCMRRGTDDNYTIEYDSMSAVKNDILNLLDYYSAVYVFSNRNLICRYLNSETYGKIKITALENNVRL